MTAPAYNDASFRAQFPAFTNQQESALQAWWDMGTAYISTNNGGNIFTPAQAQLANDLMCAHLAYSFNLISQGTATVLVQGSTEGSVTVTLTPPPVKSAFGYWLATTPYGTQLRALLNAVAGVGLFVGGSYDRASFRKAGGVF